MNWLRLGFLINTFLLDDIIADTRMFYGKIFTSEKTIGADFRQSNNFMNNAKIQFFNVQKT